MLVVDMKCVVSSFVTAVLTAKVQEWEQSSVEDKFVLELNFSSPIILNLKPVVH